MSEACTLSIVTLAPASTVAAARSTNSRSLPAAASSRTALSRTGCLVDR
uniref:Uncharacterized protein n=1 Tax=Arundo donax TaxID=35708 RepID=A0A0A9A6B7_ARUDO